MSRQQTTPRERRMIIKCYEMVISSAEIADQFDMSAIFTNFSMHLRAEYRMFISPKKLIDTFGLIYFCEEQNAWPALSGVVTDFSFANVHAVCKAFNRRTISEYIQLCYDKAIEGKSTDNSVIKIYLCCAHFIKMICHDIDRIAKYDTQRRYFKDMLAAGLSIHNINDFDDFVCSTYIILNSQYNSHLVERSKLFYKKVADEFQAESINEFIYIENAIEIDHQISDEVIYTSSPFYKRYLSLTQKISITFAPRYNKSEYFNEDMLQLVAKKYMPYCPFWSKLMIESGPLLSNAYVQNYFGQLKQNSLNGRRNLKCSEFVRILRRGMLSLSKES
ncbi:unnamed protein product [Acanthoscelides obtectus]|uniref:Transposase n=1 Tax=Acanthoscelides obtectus TaxID=200917 RepID=A0A9P0LZW9_ACAOB|nr:unnamed protein product [Acanthoscelides obtectus]CAK1641216.1 hypothetical protein AOBTE_LOCUS12245 [Acanthoscelides obtectus]